MGATTIGANYTVANWDNTESGGAANASDNAFGIGVTQDLGGGVKVHGAVGKDQAGDTVAQLGVTIGF
jgi:hypothetical protein